jgi:hypothetical protein
MPRLTPEAWSFLLDLLGMHDGRVLDFDELGFVKFFRERGLNILRPQYAAESDSGRLNLFLEHAAEYDAAELLTDLFEHMEKHRSNLPWSAERTRQQRTVWEIANAIYPDLPDARLRELEEEAKRLPVDTVINSARFKIADGEETAALKDLHAYCCTVFAYFHHRTGFGYLADGLSLAQRVKSLGEMMAVQNPTAAQAFLQVLPTVDCLTRVVENADYNVPHDDAVMALHHVCKAIRFLQHYYLKAQDDW